MKIPFIDTIALIMQQVVDIVGQVKVSEEEFLATQEHLEIEKVLVV